MPRHPITHGGRVRRTGAEAAEDGDPKPGAEARRGSFHELGDRWIAGFTLAGALLTATSLALVVIGPEAGRD
jgi:hypothetical protein